MYTNAPANKQIHKNSNIIKLKKQQQKLAIMIIYQHKKNQTRVITDTQTLYARQTLWIALALHLNGGRNTGN